MTSNPGTSPVASGPITGAGRFSLAVPVVVPFYKVRASVIGAASRASSTATLSVDIS